jgi:hypothetical protein
MDTDPQTTTGCKEQMEEERQNRRQFFNGLSKWSLAIIAAVTALRDGLHDVGSAIGSRFDNPAGGRGDPRQQIAKKKKPYFDNPHSDGVHDDAHLDHPPPRKGQPGEATPVAPGGSVDKTQ